MNVLTIPAKYRNNKIEPLETLPDYDEEHEAVILIFDNEIKKQPSKQLNLLNVEPFNLGLGNKIITRKDMYE